VDNDAIDRIIPKGAYILVDPSDREVEDGMVYALFVGKYGYRSAEFWRVRKLDNGYELLPYSTNAALHARKHYDGTEEMVTILGAAVWYAMGPDSELSGFIRPLGLDAVHGCADLPKGAIIPRPVDTVLVPVYGRIAAGEPIEMLEAIDEVDAPVTKRTQYPYSYFLIVEGDSMNKEVLGGSYVLIDPYAEVHNGDTVAVNVNGFDATLKVWHKTSNSIILSPNSTNPEHKDIVIDETSPDAPNLRVLGKMVWAMYPY
jgi:SOS-response transcriptional repressor LexA